MTDENLEVTIEMAPNDYDAEVLGRVMLDVYSADMTPKELREATEFDSTAVALADLWLDKEITAAHITWLEHDAGMLTEVEWLKGARAKLREAYGDDFKSSDDE